MWATPYRLQFNFLGILCELREGSSENAEEENYGEVSMGEIILNFTILMNEFLESFYFEGSRLILN
jgi:hypothetical protein